MKTKTNRFLSIFMILTMMVSLLTSLPMTASAEENYPGGLYFYEPWNATPATQPAGSEIAKCDADGYFETTETRYQEITTKETLTGGNNTVLTITDKDYSTVQINFPESLNGRTTSAFTTEGPNTDLIVEFDLNVDPGDLASAALPFYIVVGDKDFVYTASSKNYTMGTGSSNARRASAAYMATKVTEDGNLTLNTNAKDTGTGTDMGSVSANEWHRYKMVFHLTDSTQALTTWSLYVDGAAIQVNKGICKAPSIDSIQLTARGTTGDNYKCNIDNLSVYKKNSEKPMFSTESLAIAINRVFANKSNYETDGAESTELDDLNTAYDAAVATLNASYTTAQTDVVTAQANVDQALEELTDAQEALKDYIANLTYPGGVLLYESFTGIVATEGENTEPTTTSQPEGTTATIYKKKEGNDSGAGLGNYARQKDNKGTRFNATIPTAYLAGHTDTSAVAAQGPNAQLTLEFDFKVESEVPTTASTLTAVLLGNSSLSGNTSGGRGNSAVAIYLQSPNVVRVYSTTSNSDQDIYRLPEGVTFDQWHRYQLTVNLTDANSAGAATYTFTVDGKNVVDGDGEEVTSFTKQLSSTELTNLRIDTTNDHTTGLDNVSVYKTTETYPSLSTGALMTKLHEVNAKMASYRTVADGTSQLTALESAVTAAGNMVTSAFGTYDASGAEVTAPATQANVDTALASLTAAETALKAVLLPYYVAGHTTDETTGALTGVTVEAVKDYTAVSAKLIVATYDTNGMVEASIQEFTGAGEITLSESMDINGKLVKIFIWDIGASPLLHLASVYTFGEAADQD